jgi:hypothetical protein
MTSAYENPSSLNTFSTRRDVSQVCHSAYVIDTDGVLVHLAIADPPYLGRAAVWYGTTMGKSQLSVRDGGTSKTGVRPADRHPLAHEWDNPDRHEELVHALIDNYDGWALAMAHDNLRDILPMVPASVPVRVGIWTKTQPMPSGARVMNVYEPVIVRVPEGRRASNGCEIFPRDSVTIPRLNNGFAGSKPPAWTRWVLDLMGYDPEADEVDDLFGGSGAVARELAQGVLV